MDRLIIFFLLSIFIFLTKTNAQDVIVTTKNEAIFCKIKPLRKKHPKKKAVETNQFQYYELGSNILKNIPRSEVKAATKAENIPKMDISLSPSREFSYQREFYILNTTEDSLIKKVVQVLNLDNNFTKDGFLLTQANDKEWYKVWYKLKVLVKGSVCEITITNLMFQERATVSNPYPPKQMAEHLVLNPLAKLKTIEKYKISLSRALNVLMFSIGHRLK